MNCKTNLTKTRTWLCITAIGVALGCFNTSVQADHIFAAFDTDFAPATPGGGSPQAFSWSSIDSAGNPSSGSLSNVISWPSTPGWKDSKVNIPVPWPGANTPGFVNLEFDVKVIQADSFAAADGSYGLVQVINQGWADWGLNNGTAYNWVDLGIAQIRATNGWQRISVSLGSAPPTISQVVLNFAANPPSDPTNVVCYLVDNVRLTSPPLPPPTLQAIKPATAPGLTLIPGSGSVWQRVMVYPGPLGSDFGWYGRLDPVTYSFTIREFPTVGEFGANLFLIPDAHMQWGRGDTAGDWNSTNMLVLNITANATTPATTWNVGFNAKTNLGGGNPNLAILNFDYTQFPTGTWSLTFNNNTNITITAPNGYSTNTVVPADVIELVSGNTLGDLSLTPYFGIMPRVTSANIGLPAVFSRIQITGVPAPVDDSFTTVPLDTVTWSKLADYPGGIFVNTNNIFKYVTWNTPNDSGYGSLLAASNVAGPYQEIGASSDKWMLINGTRTVAVTKTGINAALGGAETNAAYFRLVKRAFAKLQVLMPGETAAPYTASGKTGTPDPQTVGVPFNVSVRAVDEMWNPTGSADLIRISTTDTSATDGNLNPFPVDVSLGGGIATVSVTFNQSGTWTITATDVTDGTKSPNTGSPTVVP